MMSANEFFESGPEPPWLVDACGGEIVSPNSDLEFFDVASTPSAPSLAFNHGTEAGPSNSAMHMDLDEASNQNGPTFFTPTNPLQEFGRAVQNVSSEQRRPWISTAVPSRVPTRRFLPAPTADIFRACKKRKRSYA